MDQGMEWRVLPKGDVGAQFPLLYATLNRQGSIVISRPTHERLGAPDGYLIMFDPLRHRLALKPAAGDDPNGYPARVIGRTGARSSAHIE